MIFISILNSIKRHTIINGSVGSNFEFVSFTSDSDASDKNEKKSESHSIENDSNSSEESPMNSKDVLNKMKNFIDSKKHKENLDTDSESKSSNKDVIAKPKGGGSISSGDSVPSDVGSKKFDDVESESVGDLEHDKTLGLERKNENDTVDSSSTSTGIGNAEAVSDGTSKQDDDNQDTGEESNDEGFDDAISQGSKSLDIYFESESYKTEWKNYFDYYVLSKNIYLVVDSTLAHLKSKTHAAMLVKDSGRLMVDYNIWKDILDKYKDSMFGMVTNLKPIAEEYLTDLNRLVMNSDSVKEGVIYTLLPSTRNFFSKSLYAIANGCSDLIYYKESTYSSVEVTLNYTNKLDSSAKREFKVTVRNGVETSKNIGKDTNYKQNDGISVDNLLFTFDNALAQAKYTVKDTMSMFYRRYYSFIMNSLYTLSVIRNDMSSVQDTETVRRGIVSKSESSTYMDGFKIDVVVNGSIIVAIRDKSLIDMTLVWLHIDELRLLFDEDELQKYANYMATIIYNNVLHQMILREGVVINSLELGYTIARKHNVNNNSTLHKLFKDHVKSGWVVPISPLQYDYYFTGGKIFSLWFEYMVLACMVNSDLNAAFDIARPTITIESKDIFRMYAVQKARLTSLYYTPDVVMPFRVYDPFDYGFDEFMKEMMIRLFLKDDMPDYLPLVSRGEWIGNDAKSLIVNKPKLNNIFVKFGAKDDETVKEFIDNITLRSDNVHPEKYMKSRTRLTEEVPNIMSRYIPGIDC